MTEVIETIVAVVLGIPAFFIVCIIFIALGTIADLNINNPEPL